MKIYQKSQLKGINKSQLLKGVNNMESSAGDLAFPTWAVSLLYWALPSDYLSIEYITSFSGS